MTIDDLIASAETKAMELEAACRAITEVASGELISQNARSAQELGGRVHVAIKNCRIALAQERRPNGPTVVLEWTGRVGHGDRTSEVEVIRRTDASVFIGSERYRLKDGEPADRPSLRCLYGHWRIRRADLDAIRAMPPGENEVSRALRAIEAMR